MHSPLDMRAALFCVIGFMLAPASTPAGILHIEQVGLKGYYAADSPVRVRVLVVNPEARTETIELRFRVRGFSPYPLERVDTFTQTVTLGPNEQRAVDVPLLIFAAEHPAIEVEERDAGGRILAQDRQNIEQPTYESLVAIVCVEDAVCHDAQSQISFSGSPAEQTEKGKSLKFVALQDPPAEWWAYNPATFVVLAAPLAGFSAEQREALEDHLRQGGTLIVIEDVAREPAFLAPYGAATPPGLPEVVGMGKLHRVHSLHGPELSALFSGEALAEIVRLAVRYSRNDELSWVRKRLATSFRFPPLAWLLAWLGTYILLVGPLSFAVLRRLGRQEWGWVVMPALAIVFAVGMYAASSAKRPKDFRADEVTIYWMDEQSSLAAAHIGDRVSSPWRETVEFSVPGGIVFSGDRNATGSVFLSTDLFAGRPREGTWNVRLGPPAQVELPMLQWSFRDLEFLNMKRFPGTVRRTMPGGLRNETGLSFRDALYADKEEVYFLGAIAAGAEIKFAAARQQPFSKVPFGRLASAFGLPSQIAEVSASEQPAARAKEEAQNNTMEEMKEMRELTEKPFQLVELIRGWPRDGGHAFDARSGIFFGLADAPADVDLPGVPFTRKGYQVIVVSFEKQR